MRKSSAIQPIADGILPWTKSCFVCGEANPHGLRLQSRYEAGRVVLDYTTREADLGWRDTVHGGIACTVLDEVMTWAAIIALRKACVSAEMNVRWKKPISKGKRIRVIGDIEDARSRIVLTKGAILNEDGDELASASGKYMPMRADQFALCAEDFVRDPSSIDAADILMGGAE